MWPGYANIASVVQHARYFYSDGGRRVYGPISASSAIVMAFNWSEQRQGGEFWRTVYYNAHFS